MLSHMHVVFISPLQSVVQVWRASGTAWDAGSHSLWVAAGSWDPAARFCLSIRCCLWCGVFLSGPQSSREQWFPPHATAATVQFASLHHTLFYSFPKWLQTGSSYLGIPVSRIISDLLPVLGDLSSLLHCPAKHTIHLCETSALSAQPAMLSAIIASLHSRSTCPHVPLHSPEVPWYPCCPWSHSLPARLGSARGSLTSAAVCAVCAAGTCSPPRASTHCLDKLLTLAESSGIPGRTKGRVIRLGLVTSVWRSPQNTVLQLWLHLHGRKILWRQQLLFSFMA